MCVSAMSVSGYGVLRSQTCSDEIEGLRYPNPRHPPVFQL